MLLEEVEPYTTQHIHETSQKNMTFLYMPLDLVVQHRRMHWVDFRCSCSSATQLLMISFGGCVMWRKDRLDTFMEVDIYNLQGDVLQATLVL